MAGGGEYQLASRILTACRHTCATQAFHLTAADIEPAALLKTAVSAAASHLGRPLAPAEGPTVADSRAEVSYGMLPRQPETPPWGLDGEVPLVLSLGRPDLDAARGRRRLRRVFTRRLRTRPLAWHLNHKAPGKLLVGAAPS